MRFSIQCPQGHTIGLQHWEIFEHERLCAGRQAAELRRRLWQTQKALNRARRQLARRGLDGRRLA